MQNDSESTVQTQLLTPSNNPLIVTDGFITHLKYFLLVSLAHINFSVLKSCKTFLWLIAELILFYFQQLWFLTSLRMLTLAFDPPPRSEFEIRLFFSHSSSIQNPQARIPGKIFCSSSRYPTFLQNPIACAAVQNFYVKPCFLRQTTILRQAAIRRTGLRANSKQNQLKLCFRIATHYSIAPEAISCVVAQDVLF